jgi:hypothetical protein
MPDAPERTGLQPGSRRDSVASAGVAEAAAVGSDQPYLIVRTGRLFPLFGLLFFGFFTILCVVGVFQKTDNPDAFGIAIFMGVACAGLSVVFLKQLLSPATLRFTPGGLDAKLLARRVFWPWNEIAGAHIEVAPRASIQHVFVDMADGRKHGLTAGWQLPPEQLAARILEGVERYGARRPANRPIVE